MPNILIPYWIFEQIKYGQSILFLGAGASKGAKSRGKERPLSGPELRDKLCDKFLNGEEKSKLLARVADYCINESSLIEVQQYIKHLFEPLEPEDFQRKIPTFKWHSIFTVNYDLIVERAYDSCSNRRQIPSKLIRDGDDFSKKISNPDAVPFVKLHGCIQTVNDPTLPLILSSEQYSKYGKNRILLFNHLKEWAREYPVIFCGYDIADPNINTILFDLSDMGINRPAYLVVNPSLSEYDIRFWQSKRITPIKATFQDFMNYIDTNIPEHQRVLSHLIRSDDLSFSKWISSTAQPSQPLIDYIDKELDHIYNGMPLPGVQPKDFYRGMDNSWGAFEQNLDIKRKVSDEILSGLLFNNVDRNDVRVFLLKGYAGSGKSIVLRRVIYSAAKDFDLLVFNLREGGILRPELIKEVFGLVDKRLTILVEDAILELESISELISYCEREKIPITLLLGARTNEWNVYGDALETKLSEFWELRNLSESEISALIEKLEEHDSIGELKGKKREEQFKFFKLSADRQLLVALHEATYGKPFRDIVYDEYQKLVPLEAKVLYLDICTLNRLGVGVRAGLISRISGINFNYFRKRLLKPLEHVVKVIDDRRSRDYLYKCRHPQIAKLVFDQAMADQEQRVDQIVRILKYLNVDYSSDEKAFSQIIRGRNVSELFSNKSYGERIYKIAADTGASLAYVYHQNAVFELNHPARDIRKALAYITKAEYENRYDRSLLHTKAKIYRKLALIAQTDIEKTRSRNEAKKILGSLLREKFEPYSVHSYIQILLDEIEQKINEFDSDETDIRDGKFNTRVVVELLNKCQSLLYRGLQNFPDDEYLLSGEASLAALIKDKPKFDSVLKEAFRLNPYSAFIAVRLSKHYMRNNEPEEAKGVLNKCLEGNPNSKGVHLDLAKIHIEIDEMKFRNEILSHLRKSFTDGDTNYDAQFWFARQNFVYGETRVAEKYFNGLKKAYLPSHYRNKVRGKVKNKDSTLTIYRGSITRKHDNFCFIHSTELNSDIFVYYRSFKEKEWDEALESSLVKFNLGFTLRGPSGINVECVRSI